MEENWLNIKDFENLYQVSSLGRIKALPKIVNYVDGRKRCYNECILSSKRTDGRGYPAVNLYKENGSVYQFRIHRIVAQHFIQNNENKPCINHIDGNPKNNNVTNLEWCTYQENTFDAIKRGTLNKPAKKINFEEVIKIRELYKSSKYTQQKLGEIFGIKQTQICRIINNENWKI